MTRSETSRATSLFAALLWALLAWPAASAAQQDEAQTEILWLSGRGKDQTVDWQFHCSQGRRCGEWTTIPVPSQWELQGFGSYNYGHDDDPSRESGRYRHRFAVSEDWRGRAIDLVFEGVMTDAEVWINGQSAGPKHQGAFYRFRYDVRALLQYGEKNELEVLVHKHSADGSVNRAERKADYWIFGGIYRPVYLTAAPAESIDHVAIDARHDGEMVVEIEPRGLLQNGLLQLQVETLDGTPFGSPFTGELSASEAARLRLRLPQPESWSAEFPHLYRLRVDLVRDGQLLHRRCETFGFRTFEVRSDGLIVNGERIRLKGVNRHAFWPSSGRTLNSEIDETDVALIKSMNMNAVRLSHYPPDTSFLEACDRLGLYVLNELAGWHDAYRTPTGQRLARQMVRRDVNHPSILFWDNGNEGGWNLWIDGALQDADLQRRPVLRPDELASGIDTQHYLSWRELEQKLDAGHWRNRWRALLGELPLIMPTELLHGLYDGGSGAGLEDYWTRLRSSPRGAGLFLWSFTDESVVRSDRQGALDTDGNHAPDGILGPFREKTGSYHAVRQIFAPILIEGSTKKQSLGVDFGGELVIENRFDMTDLAQCRFVWSWLNWPSPFETTITTFANGELMGPPVAPGERGRLIIPLLADDSVSDGATPDALKLEAFDPHGRKVRTWVWPLTARHQMIERWVAQGDNSAVESQHGLEDLVLQTREFVARFDAEHGGLQQLKRGSTTVDLGSGPRLVDLLPLHPQHLEIFRDGQGEGIEIHYGSDLESVRWQLYPSGWLSLTWSYQPTPERSWNGIGFAVPKEQIQALRWLGEGPSRVWKNRQQGGVLGIWNKAATSTPATSAAEPKFEGFYSNVYWARLEIATGGSLVIALEDDLYLGLFAPEFPPDAEYARAETPPEGLHFLHEIPAIGTKFYTPDELGPSGWPSEEKASREGRIWFYLDAPLP